MQTYAALIILVLLSASSYVLYDLTRLSRRNYEYKREDITELAMLIRSGGTPGSAELQDILRIDIVEGENERVLYRSRALSSSLLSLVNGTYEYSLNSSRPAALLRIRSSLIGREELLPRFRILLYTASAAVLLSGLILAFSPRSRPEEKVEVQALSAPVGSEPDHESGLMSSEHLSMRLESELKRAASFDQDLTVAMIVFEGLDPVLKLKDVSPEIRQFFVFRDLCFEYGSDEVCLLLPNTDLDDGIRTVRDFRKQLERIYPHIISWGGLSSRSGRLIDPDLLLTEAESALRKSRQDSDRSVFGFRADPEKYRALLAETG